MIGYSITSVAQALLRSMCRRHKSTRCFHHRHTELDRWLQWWE